MTLLAMLPNLRTNNLNGLGATLTIEAWASMKSFVPKDGGDPQGSAAAEDSDTNGTNDSASAEAGSANRPERTLCRQSCTC